MAWDQEQFLTSLKAAVADYDRDKTAALCDELAAKLDDGERLDTRTGRAVLAALRRKGYFDLMERVAEVLQDYGLDDNQVRRQYAQSLIDQGRTSAAVYVLEPLAECTDDPEEAAEARGLLGRIYKQLYVDASKSDPHAVGRRRTRQYLEKALNAYWEVYRSDPAHLWHGINTVALAARAARDGIALDKGPDTAAIAREILDHARERAARAPYVWDIATALEASIALGDTEQALVWLARYVQHQDADAFELSSTERQLRQVWGLSVDRPPGSLLLPLLQSEILKRKFGCVSLPGSQVQNARDQALRLEKTFGTETYVSLGWYRMGLERCRAVAQVRNEAGDGIGTGFLIRGSDLAPSLGDAVLVLTNAHVVSSDPVVQQDRHALDPDDAVVSFEALESAAGRQYKVRLVWTSPPGSLDATLLSLDGPVAGPEPFPLAKRLPVADGSQKVYVIGHPRGGGLSLSLTDNALLGYDDRVLHYRAPTEGGSSGSPVFNNQWKLIGLHHAGGFSLPRLDGKTGTYDANEGIQIQRIIEALQEAHVGPVSP